MKIKHILLLFLLSFALLLVGAQVRYRGFVKDIPVSQLLFAITAFILAKKRILKGKWKYAVLPLSIIFWDTFSSVFDNIFSNSHKLEFITTGTPNIFLCVVGATYGALLASAARLRIAGVALLVISAVFSAWYMNKGIEYWINYCSDGTFTGKVAGDKVDNWQHTINPSDTLPEVYYKDKFVVLDFWSISCLACFRKFPALDSTNQRYRNDKRMILRAVNLPIKNDSTKFEITREMAKKYTFKNVFADSTAWKAFNIDGVPTVIILQNNEIMFKGSLELAKDFLAEKLK